MIPVLTEDRSGSLRVWDDPEVGRQYVVGADVAEGRVRDVQAFQRKVNITYSDQRPDYSAAVVIEMETGLHVASWHGYMPPDQFAGVIAAIAWHYNQALLVPEVNGPGLAVLTRLTDTLRYPQLYRSRIFNAGGRDPFSESLGWRTDQQTRKILMMRVHEALNGGRLFTRDAGLISELRTMEFDTSGVERARGKNKDDRVFALALALQGRHDSVGEMASRNPTARRSGEQVMQDMLWKKVEERNADRDRGASRGLYAGWGRGRIVRPGRVDG